MGWWQDVSEKDKAFALEYLNMTEEESICEYLIRACLSSVSDTAIIPMQDYLELGDKARINIPSTLGDNWKWRMKKDSFSKDLVEKMNLWATTYFRN